MNNVHEEIEFETIIVVLCCTLSGVCQQVTIQEATNAAVNTMRYYGRNNISNSSIDSVYSMVNQGDRESVFRKSSERISKGGFPQGKPPFICINQALFRNGHLFNQMPCTGKLVDDEEHITDIDADVTADVGVVDEVAHRAFPATVEVEAEKLAFGV